MDPILYHTNKELKELVKQDEKVFKLLVERLRKMKRPAVDQLIHSLHEEAFLQFSCLDCANCCNHISPIIKENDIDRLAKHFRIKAASFLEKYLYLDEDNDYVFNTIPCPFLMPDHYCMVYENRPKACREYPHTDRRNMQQILKLTLKNCEICPVVYAIFQHLTQQLKV